MAIQVPRYDEPKVEQRGLPKVQVNTNAPLEAFGGGQVAAQVTHAAQNALGSLNEYMANAKRDADETRLKSFDKDLMEIKNKLLMDPNDGALTKKGESAFGIEENYLKAFDDYASKLDEKVSNETQRTGLTTLRDKIKLSLQDSLSRHIYQESEKYYVDTAKALVETKADDAAINYNQPDKVTQNLKDIEDTVNSFANRQGYSKPERDKLMSDSKSKAHSNVINMYLANDQDQAAQVYFEAYKKDFDGPTIERISKAIQEGVLSGNSQRKSSEIFSKHSDNMQSALDEARLIDDPELQDKTIERLKRIYSDNKAAERLRVEDNMKQAANVIEQTGSWEKVPKQMWAEFSPSERNTLKSMVRYNGESNLESYYALETLASNPATRQKFTDMNLIKDFGGKLNRADLKHFMNIQADIRQGKGETIDEMNGLYNKVQTVDKILMSAGIPKTQKKMYNEVTDKINKQVLEFQQKTGKKATTEDIQQIAEKNVMQVAVPGMFWGTNKKMLYQVQPGESIEPTSDDRIKIIEALKKNNIPQTEENILKVYMKKIGGPRGQ